MNKVRNEKVLKNFGQRIKQLRKKHSMSQDDLAAACDIEKTQIYRIEGGKINTTISTAALLAETFGLTLEELMVGV